VGETDSWHTSYQDEVEIYETFSRCEDDGNKVMERLDQLHDFNDQDVLEIGCGSGSYTPFLARRSRRLWALEVSLPLLKIAQAACQGVDIITWLHGSAERIPLPDASIDAVFASWVLTAMRTHSMRDAVDKEISRILRPGGSVWLFESAGGDEWIDEVWGPSHSKWYALPYVIHEMGYHPVGTVETQFAFPDVHTARRVLGFLLGDHALTYLERRPTTRIQHKVMILHKGIEG
jgi:ubiquinone/menaquinone biosynthesis C-methylase UbiE